MFKGFDDACPHCGKWHIGTGPCPRIRAIEYHPNGIIKRVEYVGDAPYEPPLPPLDPESPWEFVNEGKIIRGVHG